MTKGKKKGPVLDSVHDFDDPAELEEAGDTLDQGKPSRRRVANAPPKGEPFTVIKRFRKDSWREMGLRGQITLYFRVETKAELGHIAGVADRLVARLGEKRFSHAQKTATAEYGAFIGWSKLRKRFDKGDKEGVHIDIKSASGLDPRDIGDLRLSLQLYPRGSYVYSSTVSVLRVVVPSEETAAQRDLFFELVRALPAACGVCGHVLERSSYDFQALLPTVSEHPGMDIDYFEGGELLAGKLPAVSWLTALTAAQTKRVSLTGLTTHAAGAGTIVQAGSAPDIGGNGKLAPPHAQAARALAPILASYRRYPV
jgi:hypothetical protein